MVNMTEPTGTWVKTDEALIGTTELPEEGTPPTAPSPTPTAPRPPPIPAGVPYRPRPKRGEEERLQKGDVIDGFLERHERLKKTLDSEGCTTEEALHAESGIEKEELKLHKELFISDGYNISITDKTTCTLDAINDFRRRLDQL